MYKRQQLIPLGSTIYYSFFEYYRSGLKIIGPSFVGLKNYITLFATDLPKYFSNTLDVYKRQGWGPRP